MKTIKLLPIVLSIILISCSKGDVEVKLSETKGADNKVELVWNSYNEGLKKAAKIKKPVMIDFYADWCGWCKKMDKDLFQNNEIAAYLKKNFVTIRVDVESPKKVNFKNRDVTPKELSHIYGVSGLPTLVFLNSKSEVTGKLPGYIQADVFKPLLEYVSTEKYKTKVTFQEYLESRKNK